MNTNTTSPISETPKRATTSRASKITPRASKISRESAKSESDTQSPLQSSRLSIDRSPRSVTSKPTLERRSPKITISTTPPEKQSIRIAKGSELHAQLNVVQEDLKKAKEQIVLLEKEKAKVAEELKEAQKIAYEADEKLREALVAQKRAEENSEIEKFRAVELEQAGIEEVQKKELEWQKELEDVRNQHAMDVDALLSTTQELQRVKHELSMTCDAKNQALSHADDATKIAEIHAEKAVVLSAELTHLKSLLDSKLEKEASESHTVVKLKEEIESLKQELEKVKFFEEKLMEKEAFIEQLHVDLEAAKMAESYAHSLLEEWTTKVDELEASESHTVVKLKEEIESLKQELEKVKFFEEKLMEKEAFIEQLHVGLEAAKMAESYAHSLLEEWTTKVDELEMQIERANCLERSASESLDSVMKQLEGSNDLLHEAESEIASLKEKVGFLEMTVGQQRGDLEESERCFDKAREETSEMEKMVESLKYELETAKEEKNQALSNEKLAASRVQTLLEEKHKLISELENSREEEDKSKKAIESLASALHEVSAEARETKEKLLASQDVHLDYESQVENLKMVLKATNEKYEIMLDDARRELNHLRSSVKQSDIEIHYAKAEWDKKELHLVNCIKKSEEESVSMEKDINRLVNLLKQAEEEAQTMKEEEAQLKDNLKEVESEVIYMQEALAETKAKSTKIKETLLDKENQLQSIICENEELRTKEAASHKRVEELSNLLEEATTKKQTEENGVLTDNEKDYDLLHNVVEFSEGNEHESEEKPTMQLPSDLHEGPKLVNVEEENHIFHDNHLGSSKTESLNGKLKEEESKPKEDDSIEGECKMWESCKIEKKEFSPARETELESFEEEVDSKLEVRDGFDQVNGVNLTENNEDGERSPSKQQQQKKKKPLLRKFGSLLKKKGTSNQK